MNDKVIKEPLLRTERCEHSEQKIWRCQDGTRIRSSDCIRVTKSSEIVMKIVQNTAGSKA